MDLNLLRTFLVLMEERSVTRAAARLALTQSSVSNALERLRSSLGDRLLERQGNRMVPTRRARELEPQVAAALAALDTALTAPFDPAAAEGEVRLGIDEYSLALVGPALLSEVRRRAPRLRLSLISAWPARDAELLFEGRLDLIVGPYGTPPPGLVSRPLYSETFVGLVAPGHPLAAEPVTVDGWLAHPHLIYSPGGIVGANVDAGLAQAGLTRRVGAAIPVLSLAPRFLDGSDFVMNVGRRFGTDLAARHDLHLFELPIPVPGFSVGALRHPRDRSSALHDWLTGLMETPPQPQSAATGGWTPAAS